MDEPGADKPRRSRIVAWALWDTGAAGVSAIVVTFVYSVYLTSSVGRDLPGQVSPASWLGRTLAISGLTVAAIAPVIGVWVAAPHRRRVTLAVLTGTAAVLTASMSLIRDEPAYLAPGLLLLALVAACGDLAGVPYNAMLRQLSTPQNSGRISGFGWAAGYAGSVVLLLLVYVGCIAGSGPTRGLLGLSTEGGHNIRVAMLLAAAWLTVFALPLLLTAHRLAGKGEEPPLRLGFFGGYRQLWRDITAEWHRDRNLVFYLVASAIFRDGLAGVFAFGAVLGVNVYGISAGDILIFGVAASVVAAVGAIAGGLLDDRIGSKTVIVGSLVAMIAAGTTLMTLSGPRAFWACGLVLCLFIGPTQSAARTLLLRMAQDGRDGFEGVAFGLYTMTGRAVSFLAPWLFSVFVDVFGTVRAGMGGLCTVLLLGLLAVLPVRVSRPPRTP
ncbi:membrane protein [Mycolicibacter heraklionensis]|uniref:Membrane protein n=1 Tax=Mycolicibacter heraklionensis TaxID=512402 RepID=A0ABR5F9L8_9MYCO|nr:MFS transporter [Mycolicibacter heraklionensis]KLO25610.1 membrane protein [Mycolicibacter heraklionensis]